MTDELDPKETAPPRKAAPKKMPAPHHHIAKSKPSRAQSRKNKAVQPARQKVQRLRGR
jgi:hypothetical protein